MTASEPDVQLGGEVLGVVARLNRWATRNADLPIPPAQARLLAQIEELGTMRLGDLARADHCSQPTMTSQVQRLQGRGWVDRIVDPGDGRAVLVSLSDAGRTVLADVRARRTAAVAPVVQRLSGADRERLHDALDVLRVLLTTASCRADDDERQGDGQTSSSAPRARTRRSTPRNAATPTTGSTTAKPASGTRSAVRSARLA